LHKRLNLGGDAAILHVGTDGVPTPVLDRLDVAPGSTPEFPSTSINFFNLCLKLMRRLKSGKENIDYLATSLESSRGGQRVKYSTSFLTAYRATSLVPTDNLKAVVDILLTVPSSPLIPSSKETAIERHILKRKYGSEIEICLVELLQDSTSDYETLEIVTRSFYKEVDGHHIIWTCNEDSEDEVARYFAFCVLTPVENEGIVVDYWFHLNVNDDKQVSLTEQLQSKQKWVIDLQSDSSGSKDETESKEGNGTFHSVEGIDQSFKLLTHVSRNIERRKVLRRYLTMKLDIPSKITESIIGKMSGDEVGSKYGSYLGNQFVSMHKDPSRLLMSAPRRERKGFFISNLGFGAEDSASKKEMSSNIALAFIKGNQCCREMHKNKRWLREFLIEMAYKLGDDASILGRFRRQRSAASWLARDLMVRWSEVKQVELYPGLTTRKAVRGWMEANAAILTIDRDTELWLEPFVVAVVDGFLKDWIPLGRRWRVYAMTFLTYISTASDLTMLYMFLLRGDSFYATGTLMSMFMTMLMQSVAVVVAKRWRDSKELLVELLFIFTFTRPIIDMRRNVSVKKQTQADVEKGPLRPTMDVYEEFMYMKGVEVGTQNLPCCILACNAYLISPSKYETPWFNTAALSVAVGCVSSAFITTALTFDKDLDPKTRRTMSEFYGMIPDSEILRNLCFGAMMIMTTSLMVCRVFTMSMLGAMENHCLVSFVAAEVGFMLLVKLLRKDFKYWVGGGPILSLFIRVFSYATGSYTGILKLRHPLDFGGLYFTLSMVWGIALSIATSFTIYSGPQLDTIRALMLWCCILWVVSFIAVLALIKRRYWRTFLSVQTGSQFLVSNFRSAPKGPEYDEIRSEIVHYDQDLWMKEIAEEFQDWLTSNWRVWQISKPKWLNPEWPDLIPPHLLPDPIRYGPLFETIDDQHADDGGLKSETSSTVGGSSDFGLTSGDLEMGLGKRLQMSENTNRIIERLKEVPAGKGSTVEFDDKDSGVEFVEETGRQKVAPIKALQGGDKEGASNWEEVFFD